MRGAPHLISRLVARLIAAALAFQALPACSPGALVHAQAGREAVYPVPIEQARRLLAAAEAPPMVFGDGPVRFRLEEQAPTRLVWSVSRSGIEVMRYTADLSPAGEGRTKVNLALRGTAAGRLGSVEERLRKSESIRTLYLVAMQERIAADLEGRPFEMSKVYPAMTAATLDNLELFKPPPDNSRQNMKQAYRDELEGGRSDRPASPLSR